MIEEKCNLLLQQALEDGLTQFRFKPVAWEDDYYPQKWTQVKEGMISNYRCVICSHEWASGNTTVDVYV